MEKSKLQIKLQDEKKEKDEWQSKTINSVRNMIIDQLTQTFELKQKPKSIDNLSQEIKTKYGNSNSSTTPKYLFAMGVGIVIGYVFKDRIKAIFNQ